MKKHERHLTRRDRSLIEFLVRYRVGTTALVRGHCFRAETTTENVNRVVQRLERRGLVRRVVAKNGFSYFTATRRALALVGEPSRSPRPLTEQTLPVLLAIASYCSTQGVRRLASREFQDLYPELWRPGMRSSNYALIEVDGKLRLELLLVDRGGAAHRAGARVRRVIAQRKKIDKFAALMNAGRFRITILAGTPEQAGKLLRRIMRRPLGGIAVSTYVVAELADLLLLRRKRDV